MKTMFSIGETAKIMNVSIQALRYYDRKDLLKPSYINEETGYRYYSMDQFVMIDIIKYTRELNAPLEQIKEILNSGDAALIIKRIQSHNEYLDEQIQHLKNMKQKFNKALLMMEYGLEAVQQSEPYVRTIEKRDIIKLKNQEDVQYFEVNSRMLEEKLMQFGLHFTFESGYILDHEQFLDHIVETPASAYLTITPQEFQHHVVDQEYVLGHLPQGDYVCMSYNEDDKEARLAQFHSYLHRHHIVTELITTTDLYDNFKHQSTEIQAFLGDAKKGCVSSQVFD